MRSSPLLAVAAALTCGFLVEPVPAAETLYGLRAGGLSDELLSIDPGTAAVTYLGDLQIGAARGLACGSDGTLWTGQGAVEGGGIATVDRTTGAATVVGPSGFESVGAVAAAPDGALYASVAGTILGDALATVDPVSGAATLVGSYGAGIGDVDALAAAPDGALYGVSNTVVDVPTLYAIDRATGAAALIGVVEYPPGVPLDTWILALAFRGDGTLLATTQSPLSSAAPVPGARGPRSGVTGGDLVVLDPATGAVLSVVGTTEGEVTGLGLCGRADAGVFAVLPARAANGGPVTTVIHHGLALGAAAAVRLVRSGAADVVADPVVVEAALHRITATFDLAGATPGAWDVVVADAADPAVTGTLAGGFTVDDAAVALLGVSPAVGGDTGAVTLEVRGRYVAADATVRLVRGAEEIPAAAVRVVPGVAAYGEPATVTAAFDLTGRAAGAWDVVVTNPADPARPGVLGDGFAIVAGTAPRVALQIVGPTRIRTGRMAAFDVALENLGNVDAVGNAMLRGVPPDAVWDVVLPDPLGSGPDVVADVDTTMGRALVLPLLRLPPGVPRHVVLTVSVPADRDFPLRVLWNPDRGQRR